MNRVIISRLICILLLSTIGCSPRVGHKELASHISICHDTIFDKYMSMDGLLYAYQGELPTPEDCAVGRPNALGYWTPIENGAMFTGTYLSACVEQVMRAESPSANLVAQCNMMASGLVKCASVSDVPGMVCRGFGSDGKCHYSSTTTCQITPWFLGLQKYVRCGKFPIDNRLSVSNKLVEIAESLCAVDWNCPCDGVLKGQFHGSLKRIGGLPFRQSAHYLYIVRSMYGLTADLKWRQMYENALTEKLEGNVTNRIQACSLGWKVDVDAYNPELGGNIWIYVCTQECLRELERMEERENIKGAYRHGMDYNASRACGLLKRAGQFDNRKEVPFKYANWRSGYNWETPLTIKDAEKIAYGKPVIDLGHRKAYERNMVTAPLAAAAIRAYAGKFDDEVARVLMKYDFNQINICEFYLAEVAWSYYEN